MLPKTELESGCRRASIASVCASPDLGKHPELFLERIRESIGGSNLRIPAASRAPLERIQRGALVARDK